MVLVTGAHRLRQDKDAILGRLQDQPDRREHHDGEDPVEYNLLGINQVLDGGTNVGMTSRRR